MMASIQRLARAASGAIGRDSWLVQQSRPAYELMLRLMSGGRGVPWKINGVTFRVDPRCRNRLGQNYDAPVAQFLNQRSGADGMSRLGEPNRLLKSTEAIAVPVITIDEFCTDSGLVPDWMLIDIEGFEFAALRGAILTLERCRGKLGLVVEMHPNVWLSSDRTTRADAERFLFEAGLHAVSLTGQHDPLGEHGLVHLAWC